MASTSVISPRTTIGTSIQELEAFPTTQFTGHAPPDTQVAAGPSNVAEAVNDTLAVWSKTGTPLMSADLNSLFVVPSGYTFSDPRILYDAPSGRFFLSGFASDSASHSYVYVAVSATSDPTGTWDPYIVTSNTTGTSGVIDDQPKLGVSNDKVVISFSDFTSGSFSGEETWVIQKSDLLSAVASPAQFHFGPDAARFDLVPVISLSSTNTEYLVYNDSCGARTTGSCTTGSSTLGVVAINGTPLAGNVTETETDPSITPTSNPPNALQPGGGAALDTNDDRLLSAVWQNGTLWTAGNDACTPTGDMVKRSCFRLFGVSTTTTSPSVLTNLDVGSSGTYLSYPAVTLDPSGDLFVVGSISSSTTYASVYVLERLAPSGTQVSGVMESGTGVYSCSFCGGSNRWGDYSGAAVDPTNPADVWVAGEYTPASGGNNWGTAIGELTSGAPTVSGLSPQSGPSGGGTQVTVTGTSFTTGSTVSFGSAVGASLTVQSSTQLTVTSPAGSPGGLDVTVSTPAGTSAFSAADVFTYVSPPPATTTTTAPATTTTTAPATTTTTAPGPPPMVTGLSPSSGATSGGTNVVIDGADLNGATGVAFGTTAAASFTAASPTEIDAASPAGSGTVDVTVTSSSGMSAAVASDRFTYMPPIARGYWLVSAKGNVYNFGDAGSFGSTARRRLPAPITAFAATPEDG